LPDNFHQLNLFCSRSACYVHAEKGKDSGAMKREDVFRLGEGELLSLRNGRRMVVSCRAGTLWLTQQGDPADHLMAAGETFAINRRGLVVISALKDSELAVGQGVAEQLSVPVIPD
jgi:hypothetical protein